MNEFARIDPFEEIRKYRGVSADCLSALHAMMGGRSLVFPHQPARLSLIGETLWMGGEAEVPIIEMWPNMPEGRARADLAQIPLVRFGSEPKRRAGGYQFELKFCRRIWYVYRNPNGSWREGQYRTSESLGRNVDIALSLLVHGGQFTDEKLMYVRLPCER